MKQIILIFINFIFDIAYLFIVIRAFLPYLPHNKFSPFIKPVYDSTEPLLSVIRKGLPPLKIGIDASPFIAIILLYLLQQVVIKIVFLI